MPQEPDRQVVVVGGPNGAGKTRWAFSRLESAAGIDEFVNADEIARGLSPLDPESGALAAGRLMIQRLSALLEIGKNFAFETTCSGRGHAGFLERCRDNDYQITLIFLWLPSANEALVRVARRVDEGGHRIPDAVVVRRYAAGLYNMRHLYLPLADRAFIYDNSDEGGILIAERQRGASLVIRDEARWRLIEEATR